MPNLIIGSRRDRLAQNRSYWIKDLLERAHPGLVVAVEETVTGDLDHALLDRGIDLVVRDLAECPWALPEGLHLAAIPAREEVREALVLRMALSDAPRGLPDLPDNARIGVTGARRALQLRPRHSNLRFVELNGELESRLGRLETGEADATIVAAADLVRLDRSNRIALRFELTEILPGAGQGAIGILARTDDPRTHMLLEMLTHWPTRFAVEAERALLRELSAGENAPLAVLGQAENDGTLRLEALVLDPAGGPPIRKQLTGPLQDGEELGLRLAHELREAGARELLARPLPPLATMPTLPAPPPPSTVPPRIDPAPAPSPAKPRVETAPAPRKSEARNKRPSFNPIRGVSFPSPSPTATRTIDTTSTTRATATPPRAEPVAPSRPAGPGPLTGKRFLLTRPPRQTGDLAAALRHHGAEVVLCPPIEIQPPGSWDSLDRALIHLSWYDWLVFTSAHGVESFLRRLDELGHGRAELMPHRVCAIGRKTVEKLKSERISVDISPERFTAEAVLEATLKHFGVRQRLRGARMLLAASRISRDLVRHGFDRLGVFLEIAEAYRVTATSAIAEDELLALRAGQIEHAILTTPSTVAQLAALFDTDHLAPQLPNTRIICLGAATAEAARLHGLSVAQQIDEPTGPAILSQLLSLDVPGTA